MIYRSKVLIMYNQKPPMTVRYEINPPKISDDGQDVRNVLFERIETISSVCNGIHLTDSVLGIPRVSPFEIAKQIRESNKNIKLTCSLRVRDKNLNDIEKIVQESIGTVDGILVLMGDKSDTMPNKDNLIPSQVVKALNDNGLDKKIELFLSIPSNPNFAKIQKKIDAKPTGFVTQVIHSKDQVEKIVNYLRPNGFKIIPCLLLPSKNNLKSAEFLKIDWSNYKENIIEFINEIHSIDSEILVTSPNDFKRAHETLTKLAT
uniref:5 10-methylenetetrahydrofolate reductase-like protein n=1 Tax=uncultured marine thaumarchaeote KM3_85_C11 TaxID=1456316 RepID=A0A075HTC1_9ARCH|nr:5 10-methylenetetrahydrofolate reductase-like protein [uncultured marine thaumarchaeote KM3_85_C11]